MLEVQTLESDGGRFSVYYMVFLGNYMTSHAEKVLGVTAKSRDSKSPPDDRRRK